MCSFSKKSAAAKKSRPGFKSGYKDKWWTAFFGICALCSFKIKVKRGHHADHAVTWARYKKAGGKRENYSNLPIFPTCPRCNMRRGNGSTPLKKYLSRVTVPISSSLFVKVPEKDCEEFLRERKYDQNDPLTATGITSLDFKDWVIKNHRKKSLCRKRLFG